MATAHTTHRRTPRELHRVILSSKHKRLPNTRNYVVPNACFPSRLCHRSKNPYLAPDPDFLDWQCRVEKESYSTAAHLPCFHFHLDVTAKQSVGAHNKRAALRAQARLGTRGFEGSEVGDVTGGRAGQAGHAVDTELTALRSIDAWADAGLAPEDCAELSLLRRDGRGGGQGRSEGGKDDDKLHSEKIFGCVRL